MRYYPIFLNLGGRHAIVVGGGKVAERKARKLLAAGARVHVISPRLTPGLARLRDQKKIGVTIRLYRSRDIAGRAQSEAPILVFAATDNPAAQRAIRRDAVAAGALVNTADDPAACDFIVPASIQRGRLHIAISSGGADPAFAKWLRQKLDTELKKVKGQMAKGKWQTEEP